MTMTQPHVRQTLTELAAHLREVYGRDAAAVVELWRDRNFPESPMPSYHRWSRVNSMIDRRWTNRRCERCGLVEDFGPVVEGGKNVGRYVSTDGQVTQRKHHLVPPCKPPFPVPFP